MPSAPKRNFFTPPPPRLFLLICGLALILLLSAVACGAEEATERTDSDPEDRTDRSSEREDGDADEGGTTPEPDEAERPAGSSGERGIQSGAEVLSAGDSHTCRIREDGSAECWGWNEFGQATPPAGKYISVSAGAFHTCGVKTDSSVACWGSDEHGQASPPEGEFSSVSAGYDNTCGVETNGSVECWGLYSDGLIPPPSYRFATVSVGNDHACGVVEFDRTGRLPKGSIDCWGTGHYGQTTAPGGEFTSVSSGAYHTCGVKTNGSVACWGGSNSNYGQAQPPEGEFSSVSGAMSHTCGVRTDGSVVCWGVGGAGQADPPEGEFASVAAGEYHTCGAKTDGSTVCWGNNAHGRATPPGAMAVAEPTLAPATTPATTASPGRSRFIDPCNNEIYAVGMFAGGWKGPCPSHTNSASLAHYYLFNLDFQTPRIVTIDVVAHSPDADIELLLFQVYGNSAMVVDEDYGTGQAGIEILLRPGIYNIEVATRSKRLSSWSFNLYFDLPDTAAATPTAAPTAAPTIAPAPTAVPTLAPTPTAAPVVRPTPAPTPTPAISPLEKYAAEHAGGPGAIYVGDLNQLVGPSPKDEYGDSLGNVTLSALQDHLWIYESDYYQSLIEKSNLTNPTEMISTWESINIQLACMNRALPCELLETYFVPNLLQRTNEQVNFRFYSFSELGLAGPDTLDLIETGTVESATIYSGYVAGELPHVEILNLWGLYPSREQEFKAMQSITEDIEELVSWYGVKMNRNWGNDQFFFCKTPVRSVEDFSGLNIGSHGPALSDWINGMGAKAHDQFRFSSLELYRALEDGTLDCAASWAGAGYAERWYEVVDYIIGPLPSFSFSTNLINGDAWRRIPSDLQQIILEEAAKSELEALRLAAIQNEIGLQRNIDAGMEFIPFSDEMNRRSLESAMNSVIPNWIDRVGDPDHPIVTETFNQQIGRIVGLRIQRNGEVIRTN